MHSFLIASSDKKMTSSYVSDLLNKRQIDTLDTIFQTYEKSMGIGDVRDIQKTILLKPFRGKTKAVVIDAYANITQEAQNALLKVLEEPPANTLIIIMTVNKDLILPTILSRCKVIVLQENEVNLTETDFSLFEENLSAILNGKIGDKLKIAEVVAKNKDELPVWLSKMILFVKGKLLKNNSNIEYLTLLKELQKAYKAIKSTNASPRATLENLFLSF